MRVLIISITEEFANMWYGQSPYRSNEAEHLSPIFDKAEKEFSEPGIDYHASVRYAEIEDQCLIP